MLDDELTKKAAEAEKSMIDSHAGGGVELLGMHMRPVTLGSLVMLMQVGSELIRGVPISQCRNILMDCCVFIRLHTLSFKQAVKLTRNKAALEDAALELAEKLSPADVGAIIDAVTLMIKKATETQVEPILEDSLMGTRDDDVLGET